MKTQTKDDIFIGIICLILLGLIFSLYATIHSWSNGMKTFKRDVKENSSVWYKSNVSPAKYDTLLNCDFNYFVSEDDIVKCTIHTESTEPIHIVCNRDFCFKD